MKIYIGPRPDKEPQRLAFVQTCEVLDAAGFLVDGRLPKEVGGVQEWDCMYSHKRAGRDVAAACARVSQVLGQQVSRVSPVLSVAA